MDQGANLAVPLGAVPCVYLIYLVSDHNEGTMGPANASALNEVPTCAVVTRFTC